MLDGLLGEKSVKPNFFEYVAIKTLSTGALPKHVGVIMDGNRRWAKQRNLPGIEGHKQGVRSLDLLCHWMHHFEICEATVYAFSTDNFNRSEEEVNSLMNLLFDLMQQIIHKIDVFNNRGVRVDIYGNLDLLPLKLRSTAAKIILLTQDNQRRKINMAIAYKSSEEMERAAMLLKEGVNNGELLPTDIDEQLFEKCLYTGNGSQPDFLIRTSGEHRLSDFLLWQCSNKLIYITIKKWPELSFTDIFKALFYYQRNQGSVKIFENLFLNRNDGNIKDDNNWAKMIRIKNFLKSTQKRRIDYLRSLQEIL